MPWYAIDDPSSPRLDELARQYNLHPLHIEDCRNGKERVKADETDDYIFLILKYIHSITQGEIEFASISIFTGRDYFITVADAAHGAPAVFDRARKAAESVPPSKLLYLIADSVVDSYFPCLDASDERIDQLEDEVLGNPSPEVMQKLFAQKRELIELRRVLVNMRDASMNLERERGTLIDPKLAPFFRDIYDHVLRLLDSVEMLRDLLNNTLDVYLSSVANRTNQVMKVLTILSTIALPALVISGIYGMNVKGLPFLDSAYGAGIVAGAMLACTVVLLWMLKRFDWL